MIEYVGLNRRGGGEKGGLDRHQNEKGRALMSWGKKKSTEVRRRGTEKSPGREHRKELSFENVSREKGER